MVSTKHTPEQPAAPPPRIRRRGQRVLCPQCGCDMWAKRSQRCEAGLLRYYYCGNPDCGGPSRKLVVGWPS